jgi:hypothetical protein
MFKNASNILTKDLTILYNGNAMNFTSSSIAINKTNIVSVVKDTTTYGDVKQFVKLLFKHQVDKDAKNLCINANGTLSVKELEDKPAIAYALDANADNSNIVLINADTKNIPDKIKEGIMLTHSNDVVKLQIILTDSNIVYTRNANYKLSWNQLADMSTLAELYKMYSWGNHNDAQYLTAQSDIITKLTERLNILEQK